ncbi:MAG: hypothetical protein SPL02_00405 [Bacilli bacterium]|nr:hypothetical protein [Bacilli bacterium]MDY6430278.1 hypothetical protein [Bacilli bacterium]
MKKIFLVLLTCLTSCSGSSPENPGTTLSYDEDTLEALPTDFNKISEGNVYLISSFTLYSVERKNEFSGEIVKSTYKFKNSAIENNITQDLANYVDWKTDWTTTFGFSITFKNEQVIFYNKEETKTIFLNCDDSKVTSNDLHLLGAWSKYQEKETNKPILIVNHQSSHLIKDFIYEQCEKFGIKGFIYGDVLRLTHSGYVFQTDCGGGCGEIYFEYGLVINLELIQSKIIELTIDENYKLLSLDDEYTNDKISNFNSALITMADPPLTGNRTWAAIDSDYIVHDLQEYEIGKKLYATVSEKSYGLYIDCLYDYNPRSN